MDYSDRQVMLMLSSLCKCIDREGEAPAEPMRRQREGEAPAEPMRRQREGEAPTEPMRRQLGRSLALPLFFNRLKLQRYLQERSDHPVTR